jgi:hypothetical protein
MTDDERVAVRKGIAQANMSDFVSDKTLAETDAMHGI